MTLKDGTVIASGTGSVDTVNGQSGPNVTLTAADVNAVAVGGTIPESAVVGLTSDLAARALTTDSRFTDTRTPTAHATSHQDGGDDVLSLGQDQVVGLVDDLAALAPLTTTTQLANEVTALETAVTYLLGGGTPTSSPIKANWYDGVSIFAGITNVPDFQNIYSVRLKARGGCRPRPMIYYKPLGANATNTSTPTSPRRVICSRTWNEANGPDDVYALQSALTLTNQSLSNYATNASLNALESQIGACALQSSLNATNATMATLATTASLNALSTSVANSATQATVNALQTQVNACATQSSVNSLAIAVANSATLTAQNTNTLNIAALQVAMPLKADLVSGTVPLTELPACRSPKPLTCRHPSMRCAHW